MAILAIHQPNFLPFYGYFLKIVNCDKFVFLDDVQYEKGSFINRVKIFNKSQNNSIWLTCNLYDLKFGMRIDQVMLQQNVPWKVKHLRSIQFNYCKAKYFNEVYALIEKIYLKKHERLIDLNLDLIFCIADYLGIPLSKFYKASEYNLESKSNERLIDLCKLLNCDSYLHGHGATKYHDPDLFQKNKITLKPVLSDMVYPQFTEKFVPYLSIIDLLIHQGKQSLNLLQTKN